MAHPFRTGAAAVVLAAALAACGSSSSGRETAGATAPPVSRPPVTASSAGPAATAAPVPRATPDKEQPKLPAAELTPATGSFTEKEKEYLTDRVPRGMDPAAVLQTGQETCDRLTFLVKADRDTAVGAVVSGEVADAEPAVEHLCVHHRDLLREAGRGYADGTYEGRKVRPGRYRGVSPTDSCTWQITGDDGTALASGSTTAGKPARITVPEAARAFVSNGCYAWLPEGGAG
ncbi:hypothetical protein ACFYXM_27340 [Streptomyces sp. NPDC002476]|uniref:hypothetical protein n=1 Tax=Streptomyces sp. NPDC002476 TaxID=3364648 RepID=UPI0036CAA3FE